jgi:5-formyltetrahydrofolate cyclo-ligase
MPLVTDLRAEKQAIRARLKQCAAGLSSAERGAASLRICARVLNAGFFERARTIMLYAATEHEVDVGPLAQCCLALGRRICLPRTDWTARSITPALVVGAEKAGLLATLVAGRHGIREPGPGAPAVGLNEIDLIVIPGIAFDAQGNRLGRGAGFYDRFLAQPGLKAVRCGVAFSAQIVRSLPHGPEDMPVHALVTEDTLITPGKAAA